MENTFQVPEEDFMRVMNKFGHDERILKSFNVIEWYLNDQNANAGILVRFDKEQGPAYGFLTFTHYESKGYLPYEHTRVSASEVDTIRAQLIKQMGEVQTAGCTVRILYEGENDATSESSVALVAHTPVIADAIFQRARIPDFALLKRLGPFATEAEAMKVAEELTEELKKNTTVIKRLDEEARN